MKIFAHNVQCAVNKALIYFYKYHTFVGMKRRAFESELFSRKIEPGEKEFWSYVVAECLFRLNDKNIKECDCMIHQEQRKKLKAGLEKAIEIRIEEIQKHKNR